MTGADRVVRGGTMFSGIGAPECAAPMTRAEAREAGVRRYISPNPCRHGHFAARFTNNGRCCECFFAHQKKKYAVDPEAALRATRDWAARNPEKKAAAERAWREKNRTRYATKRNARSAKYRAAVIKATPAWADEQLIAAIYAEAATRSEETGVEYQVDHAVPLRGANVCGLHVADNLRVVTAAENRRKYNFFGDAT